MTLDFSSWLGSSSDFTPDAAVRAVAAWSRIQDKPETITVYRNRVAQAEQTVRIEYNTETRETAGDSGGTSSMRLLVVFGVKDHPTVADTDLKRGDLFTHEDTDYRIVNVITTMGEVQARAEATS